MYTSELIADFIEHLEVEGGRAMKTTENYQRYLERFVEFTGDIAADAITMEVIRRYRLWLNRYVNENGKSLSLITQTYHLIALRGFLVYLSRRDIPSLNADKIILPKTVRPQVTFLHYDEITRIIEQINVSEEQGYATVRS